MMRFYLIIRLIIDHQTKYKTKGKKNKIVFYRQTIVSPAMAPKCCRPKTHGSPKGFVCNTSEEVFG